MKKQNGITLIALIITIIVMLILVGVSVTVALNGGLFNTAQDAKTNTLEERDRELAISNGDIIDEYLPKEVITWTKTSSGDLAIGSTVKTSTGEEFYVIGEGLGGTAITDDSTANVILLAKYCVDPTTKKQSEDAESVSFATESYWIHNEPRYVDLNNLELYPISEGVESLIATAIEYGATINEETGRLLTKEEADLLGSEYSEIIYGNDADGWLCYWTSSAATSELVCAVRSYYDVNDSVNMIHHCEAYTYNDSTFLFGFRPVVEIPKSAIQ